MQIEHMEKSNETRYGRNTEEAAVGTVTMIDIHDTNYASSSDDDHRDSEQCPLFMGALPKDFLTNPSLAALASLLEGNNDDDDDNKKDESTNKSFPIMSNCNNGGGKLRRRKGRQERKFTSAPYDNPPKKKSDETASLGEAQLFLKLWKL